MNNTTTTPSKLTDQIVAFCREIDPTAEPEYIDVTPSPNGMVKECFETTDAHVAVNGGTVQHGWIIWETPGILLDAEFHAVWCDSNGQLIDVTPKEDGETRILFLPDSKRVWKRELVPNIRKIIRDSPALRRHLAFADLAHRIRKKHFMNGRLDAKAASRDLAVALAREQHLPGRSVSRVGRNDPCPCGSERKFKKCCGQA